MAVDKVGTASQEFRDGGELVGQSPADAWLSVGFQNVGGVLGNVLGAAQALRISALEDRIKSLTGVDPKDALSWMHNGHGFVGGTSKKTIAIGGVVGSTDPNASSKAVDSFRKAPPAEGAERSISESQISAASICGPEPSATARSTTLRSSRTLPGQR